MNIKNRLDQGSLLSVVLAVLDEPQGLLARHVQLRKDIEVVRFYSNRNGRAVDFIELNEN